MNILLIIVPPTSTELPLLGVASIASAIINIGHTVSVKDLNLSTYLDGRIDHVFWEYGMYDIWIDDVFLEKIKPIIKNVLITDILSDCKMLHTDVIGFHVNHASLRVASYIAETIKEYIPNVPIVIGGPGTFTASTSNIKWADVIFRGESEFTFLTWLRDGLRFRGVKENTYGDMNNLPVPNFSIFPKGYKQKILPLETSRGCVNRCAFCLDKQMWGKVRIKAPKILARDLESIHLYKDIAHVTCVDSIVNSSEKRLLDILPVFKSSGVVWDGMFQVRGINNDIAIRLRNAGCTNVFLGVESFSSGLLYYLRKTHTPEDARLAIQALGHANIKVSIGLIIAGIPFQSEYDFLNDIDTILSLIPFVYSVSINPLCINRITPLYKIASALRVQGLNTSDGWKLWYYKDKLKELFHRYEQCCWAVEKLQGFGIHINGSMNGFAKFFNISEI